MASSSQAAGGEIAAGQDVMDVAGPATGEVAGAADAGAAPVPGACNAQMPQNLPPALAEKPAGLPPGKYKLVGWDLETTGRRLIDEIIQMAAYTPPARIWRQYIMPYRDLHPGARRRSNVRVVTVGRYRMLKDTTKHKILKTKSEISALTDFLVWLESIKDKNEKIILMYHEPRRLHPTVLIQSLKRHHLFDQFKTLVAGFTDSYALCAETCRGTFKSVSLRVLTKLLLDEEAYIADTAVNRASAIYNIIEQLANQAGDYLDVGAEKGVTPFTTPSAEMMELACKFARPVETEVEAFEALKELVERQDTFRAAFTPLLRAPRPYRRHLTQLRRHLADAGLLYDLVKDAWHEGRRAGLQNILSPLEQTLSPEEILELVDLFENHFAPKDATTESSISMTDDSDDTYMTSDSDSSDQPSSSMSGLTPAFFGEALEDPFDVYMNS